MRSLLTVFFLFFLIQGLSSDPVCKYSYDFANPEIKWTAFKFTEKTAVSGTFGKVKVSGGKPEKTISGLAKNIKFAIAVDSINTKNPDRDEKLKKFFFGEMKNTTELKGSFKNIDYKDGKGKADMVLKMNNVEKSLPVEFIITDNKSLELTGSLDVLNWNAKKSIDTLNKECSALHIGKDGTSKLWSEVQISLKTELNYICK